jgi:predicted nucleic acid-binding protein
MRKRILDTSVLIHYWRTHIKEQGLERATPADAEQWAQDLAKLHRANAIATPVVIEFLAGTKNSHELPLARACLAQFHVADAGDVRAADWGESRRLAERVPRDGKPRQLGACLVKAIARRLKYDVQTFDQRFPS